MCSSMCLEGQTPQHFFTYKFLPENSLHCPISRHTRKEAFKMAESSSELRFARSTTVLRNYNSQIHSFRYRLPIIFANFILSLQPANIVMQGGNGRGRRGGGVEGSLGASPFSEKNPSYFLGVFYCQHKDEDLSRKVRHTTKHAAGKAK
jgi:hypothetical protein